MVGEVQVFRIRVATAESKLKLLREHYGQARQRRKEAKRLAQRARKQFKRFKANLAELKQALAKAELKLFRAGGRALARKTAKARLVAKHDARPLKKPKPVVRRPRAAAPRESVRPKRAPRKKPASAEALVVSDTPAEVADSEPTPTILPTTNPNP